MNLKRNIVGLSITTALFTGSPTTSRSEEVKTDVKETVSDVIFGNTSNPESLEEKVMKSNLTKIKISDIKGGPLDMLGIHAKDDLKQFFGLNQYETVFEKYNPTITKKDKQGRIITNKNSYKDEELSFPRIHDMLRPYFPDTLSEFADRYREFKKDIADSQTVVLIMKLDTERFAMGYYKNGILFLATHVSPGKKSPAVTKTKKNKKAGEKYRVTIPGGNNSPQGVYRINKCEGFKFKKSNTFELSPMPYAMQITGGVFCHHGQDVDGQKRSHGCIRVPGFYEKELYENMETGTKIIIKGTKS